MDEFKIVGNVEDSHEQQIETREELILTPSAKNDNTGTLTPTRKQKSEETNLKNEKRILKCEKFDCENCRKRFDSLSETAFRGPEHTGIHSYACRICFRAFLSSNDLELHLLLHSIGVQFKCSNCDEYFESWHSCEDHERHPTEDTFQKCTFCHHSFTSSTRGKDHHPNSNEKETYSCLFCRKARVDFVHKIDSPAPRTSSYRGETVQLLSL
ncbi:unnamed protein product [Cyprideis torosa]|uniref:Uncharacterized protein n=1 Tax=Cyprideis torosa TaxID=163714 RepID=A0A7R8WNE0_9CRUS|nr:unnamed protein product [Cyprideis torosa]CAG0904642.1 unnamed protein product [Cyprideis torosa]